MACHGELARTRPAAKYLTGFYVALSFGGMVGGLFAGLIAPFTFSWIAEYPILLALAALCRPPGGDERLPRWSAWYWPFLAALAVALIAPSYSSGKMFELARGPPGLGDRRGRRARGAAGARAECQPLEDLCHRRGRAGPDPRSIPSDDGRVETVRSFFGVHKIVVTPHGQYHVLMHGTTIHGAEKFQQQRRHAGHRAARADHLLPQGRRHRAGDHGDPRAQGRAAQGRGDRARLGHAGLRLGARRRLEVLRDRPVHGRYRPRSEIFHLHPELRAGPEARDRRCAADLRQGAGRRSTT